MKVGVIAVFTDYHRRGAHHRGVLQPQIGPLIAALLPDDAEIHVVNDTWEEPDFPLLAPARGENRPGRHRCQHLSRLVRRLFRCRGGRGS